MIPRLTMGGLDVKRGGPEGYRLTVSGVAAHLNKVVDMRISYEPSRASVARS
jgi:hypothetical protein